jgi:hypothetical protein
MQARGPKRMNGAPKWTTASVSEQFLRPGMA